MLERIKNLFEDFINLLKDFIKVFYWPLVIPSIIVFIVFVKYDFAIIPDYFEISLRDDPSNIIEIIISSIASIIGIFIAIILIGYESIKERLGRKGNDLFLTSGYLKGLTSLLIISLLWPFAIIVIEPKETLTLIYISIILFSTSILLLFPMSYRFLMYFDSIEIIKDEIKKINSKYIREKFPSKSPIQTYTRPLSVNEKENEPPDIISAIAQDYIKRKDYKAIRDILNLTIKKVNELILEQYNINKTTSERNAVKITLIFRRINTVSIIWNQIINEAITQKDIQVLDAIWDTFYSVHEFTAKKKIELMYTRELYIQIRLYLDELQKKHDAGLNLAFYTLTMIVIENIKHNSSNQDSLKELRSYYRKQSQDNFNILFSHFNETNTDKNFDKPNFLKLEEYLNLIKSLTEYSLQANNLKLIKDSSKAYTHIIGKLISMKSIGEYLRAYYIINAYQQIFNLYLEYFKGNTHDDFFLEPINPEQLAEYVKDNEIFFLKVLEKFKAYMIDFSIKYPKSMYSPVETIAETAKYCCELIRDSEPKYYDSCKYIIDSFVELKEKTLDDNKYKDLHVKLKDEIGKILDYHNSESQQKNQKFIDYCSEKLKEFPEPDNSNDDQPK